MESEKQESVNDEEAGEAEAAAAKPKSRRRLRWILALGGVAVLLALAWLEFRFRRPIGSGPAGPKISQTAFAEVWSEKPYRLLGIGDSVTAGLGAKSRSHSYFRRLLENPEDEYADMQGRSLSVVLPDVSAQNVAISGSESLLHHEVIDELPDFEDDVFGIVVMTTGGNDLIHSYGRSPPREGAMYGATLEQARPWIAAFSDRLDSMLDKIQERFPAGCEIFLGDIYDPTDGRGDAPSVFLPDWPDGLKIHSEYNRVIHARVKARENVHVVPLHALFLGHGSHCREFWSEHYDSEDPHYWYYFNIEDPNDRGYDAIRRAFLKEILAQKDRIIARQPRKE